MKEEKMLDVCVPASPDAQCIGGGGHAARVVALDIDDHLLETRRRSAEGELITFVVLLPEGRRVQLQGKVIYRSAPTGVGILFTPLTAEQDGALSMLMNDMLRTSIVARSLDTPMEERAPSALA